MSAKRNGVNKALVTGRAGLRIAVVGCVNVGCVRFRVFHQVSELEGLSSQMALTGIHVRSLDEKCRVAVPKLFRDELLLEQERRLFLAPETDRSLSLFSVAVLERRAQRLGELSGPPGHAKNYMRLYYSQAEQVEVDSQGRIRLPERLKGFASIQQEVVLIGVHDHVEIWDKGLWEQFLATHSTDFDRLASEAFE